MLMGSSERACSQAEDPHMFTTTGGNYSEGRGCGYPYDQQKMTQPVSTEMAIPQLPLGAASSNLVGRSQNATSS